jgi:hypothetical protein
MALEVRNAPGQAGYAFLVFEGDISGDPLRLAILNRISRNYLGHSVGKAIWTPARSHFFDAKLVSRGDGVTIYVVGPEVTTFIPDETTLELSSEDGTVQELVVWRGILLRFHWHGSAINVGGDARGGQEDATYPNHEVGERRRRPVEAKVQQKQPIEAEREIATALTVTAEELRIRSERLRVEEEASRRAAAQAAELKLAQRRALDSDTKRRDEEIARPLEKEKEDARLREAAENERGLVAAAAEVVAPFGDHDSSSVEGKAAPSRTGFYLILFLMAAVSIVPIVWALIMMCIGYLRRANLL